MWQPQAALPSSSYCWCITLWMSRDCGQVLHFSTQVSKAMAGNVFLPVLSAMILPFYVFFTSLVFKKSWDLEWGNLKGATWYEPLCRTGTLQTFRKRDCQVFKWGLETAIAQCVFSVWSPVKVPGNSCLVPSKIPQLVRSWFWKGLLRLG